jgi:hypothetical protein
LKEKLAAIIPEKQKEVKEFRTEHGNTKVGEVTVDMMYGGMRGIRGLVTETSLLDPEEGIRFRGYSIPECQELLPKADGGAEPLPEGIFYLMLTGDIPTNDEVSHTIHCIVLHLIVSLRQSKVLYNVVHFNNDFVVFFCISIALYAFSICYGNNRSNLSAKIGLKELTYLTMLFKWSTTSHLLSIP